MHLQLGDIKYFLYTYDTDNQISKVLACYAIQDQDLKRIFSIG